MKIADTCSCGAMFCVESKSTLGALDAHEQWLDSHEDCRTKVQTTVAVVPEVPEPPQEKDK